MAQRRRSYAAHTKVSLAAVRTLGMVAHANVELRQHSTLRLNPRNARTHSKKQVRQIAASIERFGFTNPVLIDEQNMVVAGHGRLAAARLLGLKAIPCLCIGNMSPADKRAYALADNKLAANAGWDEEILAEELAFLAEDPTFDLGLTGFSVAEIDSLVEGLAPEEPGAPEDDRLAAQAVVRCKLGDLWQMGQHLLICGDALDPAVVARLMRSEQAQMVFTDPPYNVPIQGHVGGSGAIKHREFAMASGEMTPVEFVRFLRTALQRLIDGSSDGSARDPRR